MSGFRENGQKSQKSGRATFLTLFTPNFVPGFGKILGAVSEIIRYKQTNKLTHRSDFIGSSRFSTGNQYRANLGVKIVGGDEEIAPCLGLKRFVWGLTLRVQQ